MFVSGSDLVLSKKIRVVFVRLYGIARRPVAHTCGCILEVSEDYTSFAELKEEFGAVLASDKWVMDIV